MEFDWDKGNLHKISERFEISDVETFFKQELFVIQDESHSIKEIRYIAVGLGPGNKPMFVCYTFRGHKIRVISARFMSNKEAIRYEKFKKEKIY